MKNPLRWLKIGFLSILFMILLGATSAVGFVTWCFYYPQKAWALAEKHLLPGDMKIAWEQLSISLQPEQWNHWVLISNMKNVSIKKINPHIDVGISSLNLKLQFQWKTNEPLYTVSIFEFSLSESSMLSLQNEEPTDATEKSVYQLLADNLSYLSYAPKVPSIDTLDIYIPHFEIYTTNEKPIVINTRIKQDLTISQDSLLFEALVNLDNLSVATKGQLHPSELWTDRPLLKADLHIQSKDIELKTPLSLIFNKNKEVLINSLIDLHIKAQKNKMIMTSSLAILVHPKQIEIKSLSHVKNIPGPLKSVAEITLNTQIPQQDDQMWTDTAGEFNLSAPVDVFLIERKWTLAVEKACRCKLPKRLTVSSEGQFWMKSLLQNTSTTQKAATASLKIETVKNNLFTADLALDLSIDKKGTEWLISPRTNADIVIHSFQGLRRLMEAQGLLLPAPLNALDGTVSVSAHSPVTENLNQMNTTVSAKIDLSSKTQKAVILANSNITLPRHFKSVDIHTDLKIKQLRLELPPIDPIRGVPKIASDPRIQLKPLKIQNNKSNFKINLVSRLQTETEGAIQLLNTYSTPYIPVSVDIDVLGELATGKINVEPFKISYLRRDIFVETLNVQLPQGKEAKLPLDGKLRINQGGYAIFIILKGTADSPQIILDSTPSLSQNDIISVLLYGRISDQLVANEAETAGGVNAAIADRAIGIIGLWAFASTPIQSFSYNAVTKVYTATVKLSEGFTAGVGTNWEQATILELRKRLSRRWVLTATWTPTQNNRQEGRLVLQWEHRF